jgi:hypothetical protein
VGILRFQKWVFKLSFVVDIWPFLTWQLFGLFCEKFGNFYKSFGHPAQDRVYTRKYYDLVFGFGKDLKRKAKVYRKVI